MHIFRINSTFIAWNGEYHSNLTLKYVLLQKLYWVEFCNTGSSTISFLSWIQIRRKKYIFETAGRIWFLFMMANIGIYWRKFPLYIISCRNLDLRFVKGYFDLRVTSNISAQGCFYMNNERGGKRSLSLIDLSKYQTLRSMVHIHY